MGRAYISFMFKLLVTSAAGHVGVMEKEQSPIELVGCDNVADAYIGGKLVKALIDTGSMVSTICDDFYVRELQDTHQLLSLQTFLEIEGAGGNQVPYKGYIDVSVSVRNGPDAQQIYVPVLVVFATRYSCCVPMIVGTNILRVLQDKDVFQGVGAWAAAVKSMVRSETVDEVAVYCKTSVTVPPCQSIVICGRVGATRPYKAGILQAAESLPGGLIIPECAVKMNDNMSISVQLVNVSAHPVEIPKRQRVAMFTNAVFLAESEKGKDSNCQGKLSTAPVQVDLGHSELTSEQKGKVEDLVQKWNSVFASTIMRLHEQSKAHF